MPARKLTPLEAIVDVEETDSSRLTRDELYMRLLALSRRIVVDPSTPAAPREEAARYIAEIEGGIRRQALARCRPSYGRHLAQVAGGRFPDYVPCVCGDPTVDPGMLEYHDLDKPRVMERRAAILARPDIQALLAEAVEVAD